MITQHKMNSTKSSKANLFVVSLNEVIELVTTGLMYENDLNRIPLEQTAPVATALIARAVREIASHPSFEYEHLPSELVSYTLVYFNYESKGQTDLNYVPEYLEYETKLLRRYYTPDTLDDILTDIQYKVLQSIYGLTPNTTFTKPVKLMLPSIHGLHVFIEPEDLEEADADLISDGSDSGLHSTALLDRFLGDDSD